MRRAEDGEAVGDPVVAQAWLHTTDALEEQRSSHLPAAPGPTSTRPHAFRRHLQGRTFKRLPTADLASVHVDCMSFALQFGASVQPEARSERAPQLTSSVTLSFSLRPLPFSFPFFFSLYTRSSRQSKA